MVFRVVKTSFNSSPRLAGDDRSPVEKFARQVANRTISYTTYFPGWDNAHRFKMEIISGEQYSTKEVYEEGDIEVYLSVVTDFDSYSNTKDFNISRTAKNNHNIVDGLNKALYVLQEFVRMYRRRVPGGVKSVRFVTFDPKIDVLINRYIDSPAFMSFERKMHVAGETDFDRKNKVTAQKVARVFAESTLTRLLEKKGDLTDEEINRPPASKFTSNPDKFEHGDHLAHFDAVATGLKDNSAVICLGLGRLNDDGGDYDTITLSGEETKVEVKNLSSGSAAALKSLLRTAKLV